MAECCVDLSCWWDIARSKLHIWQGTWLRPRVSSVYLCSLNVRRREFAQRPSHRMSSPLKIASRPCQCVSNASKADWKASTQTVYIRDQTNVGGVVQVNCGWKVSTHKSVKLLIGHIRLSGRGSRINVMYQRDVGKSMGRPDWGWFLFMVGCSRLRRERELFYFLFSKFVR